jgi:hypothetical protein
VWQAPQSRTAVMVAALQKRYAVFALVYMGHFDNADPAFLEAKLSFMNDLKSWAEKYLGSDFKELDLDGINELANQL